MNENFLECNNISILDSKVALPSTIQDLSVWRGNFFKQSNCLVEAVFEQPFKEFELKILALISRYISQHNSLPFDEEAKLVKIIINKNEFCQSLSIDPQHFYHMAKSIAPDFHKKSILIEILKNNKINKTKKEFYSMSLVPMIACKDNQIIFYISPVLQPYLQKLKAKYTLLSLEYISKMGSSHAIKIYQLLAQYQKIKKRTFSVSELKKILGIANKYRDFQRFKEEVIEVAIKHININSNLRISYATEKVGKKTENIIFKIAVKETQFQQAIHAFTVEMDNLFEKELDNYEEDHRKAKLDWEKSKKNIEENKTLFEEWIQHRTKDYHSDSIEKLHLVEDKDWYINFHKRKFQEILKQYNFSTKKINQA